MKKNKFTKTLTEAVRREESQKTVQEHLKNKYHVKDNNVVIVEKSNVGALLFGLVRGLAYILLFLLAVIGLAALIYPASRIVLAEQATQVWQEFLQYLP